MLPVVRIEHSHIDAHPVGRCRQRSPVGMRTADPAIPQRDGFVALYITV